MKVFEGVVISNQMESTVVVEVFRVKPHPLYRKLVKLSKKYKADTAGLEEITVGSVVRITETKPVSKDKYFKVSKIITKGDGLIIQSDEEKVKEVLKNPVERSVRVRKSTTVSKGNKSSAAKAKEDK